MSTDVIPIDRAQPSADADDDAELARLYEVADPDDLRHDRAAVDAEMDRLLYIVDAIAEEKQRNADVAQRRMQPIMDWCEAENAALDRRIDFLASRLRVLMIAYDYGRAKSRTLPSGRHGTRERADTIDITDADAALAFARRAGLPTVVVERVNKTPLLDYLRTTGELPDGCEHVPAITTRYIDTPHAGRIPL